MVCYIYWLIDFKVKADLGNLRAANIRNHDFGNLVFEIGHQLPTIFSISYVINTLPWKSSLERINTPNTKHSELLEKT